MKLKNYLLRVGLFLLLCTLMPASIALAGAGIEPIPPGATTTGPEIWGVVIMRCDDAVNDIVALRVKRIVDCDVETQVEVDWDWQLGCPATAADMEDQGLPNIQFFNIGGNPFFNKIKNFNREVNGPVVEVSFDAQFKFYQQ